MKHHPAIVIAGTGSGVGKTSLTLGLSRALTRRGLRVQTFKVGPDFLDPSYLAAASGRTCYNLDGWMTSREYVTDLFARKTVDADLAVVEGVMGLFDGASPATLEGSTAEIASWLNLPVALVVNAHGTSRSLAAMVKGFAQFEPSVRVAGVIANQTGTDRHKAWLADSLLAAALPPLLGGIPRDSLPALQSRHLGLVTADPFSLPEVVTEKLADAVEQYLDIPALLSLASAGATAAGGAAATATAEPSPHSPSHAFARIGIARDKAFHFYYPDNLEMLAVAGAQLVEFSPLADPHLPADLKGLYFGGGYPELHASQLSANTTMLDDVRRFASSGRAIYAECGGLMYLGRTLRTIGGQTVPLAGVLPIDTAMLEKLKTLGYVEATPAVTSMLGQAGQAIRGHEFHYSQIVADNSAAQGWHRAYSLRRRRTASAELEGYCRGNILASYVHVHFASRPEVAGSFIQRCKGTL